MINELSDDLDAPTINRVIGKEMQAALYSYAEESAESLLERLAGKFVESDLPTIQKELVDQFRFVCEHIYMTAREQTLIQVEEYLRKRLPDFDALYEHVLPEDGDI